MSEIIQGHLLEIRYGQNPHLTWIVSRVNMLGLDNLDGHGIDIILAIRLERDSILSGFSVPVVSGVIFKQTMYR